MPNFSSSLHKESSPMPGWLTITTILLGVGILAWQLILFGKATTLSDGQSYIDAWRIVRTGYPEMLRTPIYAIFAGGLIELLGQKVALIVIPIIHWAAYLGSLQLMWRINCWLGITRKINIGVILSMLLIPGFWVMNHSTMAECLSICGVILLIWLCGRFLLTTRWIYLIATGILVPTLIMTKPMFVMLIPVMTLFWAIACWKRRKQLALSIGFSLLSITVTVGYIWSINHLYQIPVMTCASNWNEYIILRSDGFIRPDEIDDPELREEFRPFYEESPEGWGAFKCYWQEIWILDYYNTYRLTQIAYKNHRFEIYRKSLNRFALSLPYSHFFSLFNDFGYDPTNEPIYAHWNGMTYNQPKGHIYPFHRYIWYPMWVGYMILILFSAYWIRQWIRNRQLPLFQALIAATMFCAYVTVIIGAQDSWGRILTPFNPIIPIMAGSLLTGATAFIKKYKTSRKLKQYGC